MHADNFLIFLMTLCFLLFFMVVSWLYVLYPQYQAFRWGRASKNWPQAKGKITISELKERYWRHWLRYNTEVWYEYKVNGVRYAANRIGFGVFLDTFLQEADRTLEAYRPEQSVTVHYHPSNPKLSVLVPVVPGIRMRFGIMLSAIVIVVMIGLVLALIALVNFL